MTERERHKCLEVLGLTTSASEDDIKKAYRSLAKQYHPDKNTAPGSKERFQEIGYAYKYLTEGPSVVEEEDDDIMVEVLIRMFPWMFTGGFPGAFHPFASHFFEPRPSPPHSFHRYHHCHHFDPYDYVDDEYYDTDSDEEYFDEYPPKTDPGPTTTTTKADRRREKKRQARARKKAAKMEKASQTKTADPPPQTKSSSVPKEETRQKPPSESKGSSQNGVSSETKSSSKHVSSAQRVSSNSRSMSPASGGSPRTEQKKSTPPVAPEPKKTKKQLQAEQKKREKEMEAIAAEFKKKQKEEEDKAAQKKAAKEEREKLAAMKAKEEQERAAKEEQERVAKQEQAAREEREQAVREELERAAKREQAAREERARAAREKREQAARWEREQAARVEQERAAREELERAAAEEWAARECENAAREERKKTLAETASRDKLSQVYISETERKNLYFGKSENRLARGFELDTAGMEFYQTDCRPKTLDDLSTNSQTYADICTTETSHHKSKKKRKNKKKSEGVVNRDDLFENIIPKTEDEELDMLQEAILRSQMEAEGCNLQTESNGRSDTEVQRLYFDTLDDVSDDADGSSVFPTTIYNSRSEKAGWHDFISVKTSQEQHFKTERTNIQYGFTENRQAHDSSGMNASNAYLRSKATGDSHLGQVNIGQGRKQKTSSGSNKDSWEFGGNAEQRFIENETDIQFGFGAEEVTLSSEVMDAKDKKHVNFQQNHKENNYFDQQNYFLENIVEPSLSWAEQMELEQPTFDKVKGQNLGQGQPSLYSNAHSVSSINDMDDIDDVDMCCESSGFYANSSLSAASIDLTIPNAFSNKDALKSYYKSK